MRVVTERLIICELSLKHAEFMFAVMNTQQWKEFIGDRNIQSNSDASAYIQKIIDTPNADYWLIELVESNKPIGIVTFMKRDYLDHFDIGFALLPQYFGKGYAFEASSAVLNELEKDKSHKKIVATTIPSNVSSIALLERLGFEFEMEIEQGNETLALYANSSF